MDPLLEKMREAINLSAREKRGTIVVILIMVFIWFLPDIKLALFPLDEDQIEISYLAFEKQLKEKVEVEIDERRIFSRFTFDPNTVSKSDLSKLGFQDYLSDRLIKYRDAGGKFRKREDMMKLYGMSTEFYTSIEDYIDIEKESKIERGNSTIKLEKLLFDMNKVDSAQLLQIKGIGPVYAHRITKYRDLLGGYTSIDQLKEVYGIRDSNFQILRPYFFIQDTVPENRISINDIDVPSLRSHPYFRDWKISNAIVKYQKANGKFEKKADLYNVHLLNDSIIDKISPYIIYE